MTPKQEAPGKTQRSPGPSGSFGEEVGYPSEPSPRDHRDIIHRDQDRSVACQARNQMQRSGLELMVRPETSRVSLCPAQAPPS